MNRRDEQRQNDGEMQLGRTMDVVLDETASLEQLLVVRDTAVAVWSGAGQISESFARVAECVRDCVAIRCEFEALARELDLSYAHRLRRLEMQGPALRAEIHKLSDRVDRLLDKALEIDTATATITVLETRTSLLVMADRMSERLSRHISELISM